MVRPDTIAKRIAIQRVEQFIDTSLAVTDQGKDSDVESSHEATAHGQQSAACPTHEGLDQHGWLGKARARRVIRNLSGIRDADTDTAPGSALLGFDDNGVANFRGHGQRVMHRTDRNLPCHRQAQASQSQRGPALVLGRGRGGECRPDRY